MTIVTPFTVQRISSLFFRTTEPNTKIAWAVRVLKHSENKLPLEVVFEDFFGFADKML